MAETEAPRILLVDDNPAMLYVNAKVLRQKGFEVITAATGAETLSLLDKRPDLVLLDVKLPDMSGIEVCRKIKNNPETRYLPVLHLSATYTGSEHQVDGLEAGADGYLIQPINPGVLTATVNAFLRLKKSETELRRANGALQHLLEISPDIIYRFEFKPQPHLVFVSPAVTKILGYTPAEILSSPQFYQQVVHPDDLPVIERWLSQRSQRPETNTVRFRPRQGKPVWLEINSNPLFDDANQVIGNISVARDITMRKLAEAERAEIDRKLKAERAAIKTASGFIPICAGCKKIRDENNVWQELEAYFEQKMGLSFTHGLCPVCLQKYYPEYTDKKESEHGKSRQK